MPQTDDKSTGISLQMTSISQRIIRITMSVSIRLAPFPWPPAWPETGIPSSKGSSGQGQAEIPYKGIRRPRTGVGLSGAGAEGV